MRDHIDRLESVRTKGDQKLPEQKTTKKFIQITAAYGGSGSGVVQPNRHHLYALDEDGQVWMYQPPGQGGRESAPGWQRLLMDRK